MIQMDVRHFIKSIFKGAQYQQKTEVLIDLIKIDLEKMLSLNSNEILLKTILTQLLVF